jgi:hypothetical protein
VCLKISTSKGILCHLNPLNTELNPICYLLALLAHHFLHVSRIRVNCNTGESHFLPPCELDFLRSGRKILIEAMFCVQMKNESRSEIFAVQRLCSTNVKWCCQSVLLKLQKNYTFSKFCIKVQFLPHRGHSPCPLWTHQVLPLRTQMLFTRRTIRNTSTLCVS